MMWLPLLICLLAASAEAQDVSAAQDATALLLQVRKKVMLTIRRLPRFLCTETIDRSAFQPAADLSGRSCDDLAGAKKWKRKPYSSDRLRLDVAVSNGGEMFSWVGENHFHDRSLAELVGSGATSTGSFSSFLSSIFGNNSASFTYEGNSDDDGRAVVRFGFTMPLEKSGYSIGNREFRSNVPYHGTIVVDSTTFNLVRLTIHADRLPIELHTCDDTTVLDYGTADLDNFKFLLPKDVYLHITYTNGTEFENRTTFSGCHEFMGEATLSFDEPADTGQAAAPKKEVKPLILPPDVPFKIALTEAIDTATAAAGDLVHARLMTPIRNKENGILAPKEAAVAGRIVHIERFYGPVTQSLALSVQVETVEVDGVAQPFPVRLESVVKARAELSEVMAPRLNLGTFDQMEEESGQQDAGVLLFEGVGKKFVIRRGIEIAGRTKLPAAP